MSYIYVRTTVFATMRFVFGENEDKSDFVGLYNDDLLIPGGRNTHRGIDNEHAMSN